MFPDDANCARTGKSIQNMQIERRWRDTNWVIASDFRRMFYGYGTNSIILPGGLRWDLERAVLTRIFLPYLQMLCDMFKNTAEMSRVRKKERWIRCWNDGWNNWHKRPEAPWQRKRAIWADEREALQAELENPPQRVSNEDDSDNDSEGITSICRCSRNH